MGRSQPLGNDGSRGSASVWIVVGILILAGLFAIGFWPRLQQARRLGEDGGTSRKGPPSVTVAKVEMAPDESVLELPGNVQSFTETGIFARTDGYVRRSLVDIGDRVKAGQLLVELESPELDQQVREARAALERAHASVQQAEAANQQAVANHGLAKVTAERWSTLVDKGVLSEQGGDEKRAALKAREADLGATEAAIAVARGNIAASEAALQRLLEVQAFRQVRAPFDGVITVRNIDIGSLVSAGSGSSLRELFRIAQVHLLKIYVDVPQSEVAGIRPGIECVVKIREVGGESFQGKVTRTAGALDSSSRTLPVEVQIANPEGRVLPGMYAVVSFDVRRPIYMSIPSEGYRNTGKGPVAAVLRPDETVRMQLIELGRDDGTRIEVLDGLKAGETIITSFSDEVKDGVRVKPVVSPKPAGRQNGGPGK